MIVSYPMVYQSVVAEQCCHECTPLTVLVTLYAPVAVPWVISHRRFSTCWRAWSSLIRDNVWEMFGRRNYGPIGSRRPTKVLDVYDQTLFTSV